MTITIAEIYEGIGFYVENKGHEIITTNADYLIISGWKEQETDPYFTTYD